MCQYCSDDHANHHFYSDMVFDTVDAPPAPQLAVSLSGDTLTDGLLYSGPVRSRSANAGEAATVSYSFTSTVNDSAQSGIVEWLNVWSGVANLTFNQVTSGGDMNFIIENLGGGVRGRAELPPGSSVWLNSAIDPNLVDSGPLWSSVGHEIGHSLGLAHTFGGALNLTSTGQHHADYSIMAYSSADGSSTLINRTEYDAAVGYADVKAIQYLYGANTNHNSGDTVYSFADKLIGALWDGGGNDVISAVGDSNGATIDLRDGGPDINAANMIGESRFYVASGANIEHAIGSASADTIRGSDSGNEIYGGSAGDIIYGGGGGDVIFGGNGFTDTTDGDDRIYAGNQNDLVIGNAGDDQIFGDAGPGATATAPGNDTLYGGAGNDLINGEQGFDVIVAGPGNDSIYGGADADAFVFANDTSGGVNIIYDFQGAGTAGGDVIRIFTGANGSALQTAADVISAIVTDGVHSYIPVIGADGGYGILVAWTQGLTADDINVVGASDLLSAVS